METINSDLLTKYDVPVPRYTSYPTVPFWSGIDLEAWDHSVHQLIREKDGQKVSLYVHVPFCRSLCSFCGCTKVISRDYTKADSFVDTLLLELTQKLARIGQTENRLDLCEVHLGGGTPTWLPPPQLKRLIEGLKLPFAATAKREISIEVDPRTCTDEHVKILAATGVTRVSLGVQDFHLPTLRAIKREQPYTVVRDLVAQLREHGLHAINFDLVYGLPYQTIASMNETIEKVIRLRPSRIALYSYAHIPAVKLAQRGVEKHGLPSVDLKRDLYTTAARRLRLAGYQEIGMDHFALPRDDLYVAQLNGELHRNFMGYTVQKTRLLLGLGPSSLSDAWYAFYQNVKDVTEWEAQVKSASLVPIAGHQLNDEDLRRRRLILDLMCDYRAAQALTSDDDKVRILESEAFKDGLLDCDDQGGVQILEKGIPFVRNICGLFDEYLFRPKNHEGAPAQFSRGI